MNLISKLLAKIPQKIYFRHKNLLWSCLLILGLTLTQISSHLSTTTAQQPSSFSPREFRGVWVASVANIDWPSQPGLPVAQQKTELLNILNRMEELNLNALVL